MQGPTPFWLTNCEAIIQFHHLSELVGQLAPRGQNVVRIGRLAVRMHYIDILMFVCNLIFPP